jgi:hypothetical protein
VGERPLSGCFVGRREAAFIFVDASLPAAERRWVLAHEVGHYLAHYREPRRRVERRLGTDALAVLDGTQPSRPTDILAGCLTGVDLRPYVHFMARGTDGALPGPVSGVERTADLLALEILAPRGAVFRVMRQAHAWPGDLSHWVEALQTRFGLPTPAARRYAEPMHLAARAQVTFSQALGL